MNKEEISYENPGDAVNSIIRNVRSKSGTLFGDFLNQQPFCFSGDGLSVFARNLGFLRDPEFVSSYEHALARFEVPHLLPILKSIVWRKHIFCSLAHQCLPLEGDFVECGVEWAFGVDLASHYLKFSTQTKKTWFLYDTFSGVPEENLDSGFSVSKLITKSDQYEIVKNKFSSYENIRVIKGKLPESLIEASPKKISFLHIDLNNAKSELDVLIELAPRVVQGGVILLDDYGALLFAKQHELERKFMSEIGVPIIELPTGQGLIIKNFPSERISEEKLPPMQFEFKEYLSKEAARIRSSIRGDIRSFDELQSAYNYYMSQVEHLENLLKSDPSQADYKELLSSHGTSILKIQESQVEYSTRSDYCLFSPSEARIRLQMDIDALQSAIDSRSIDG